MKRLHFEKTTPTCRVYVNQNTWQSSLLSRTAADIHLLHQPTVVQLNSSYFILHVHQCRRRILSVLSCGIECKTASLFG